MKALKSILFYALLFVRKIFIASNKFIVGVLILFFIVSLLAGAFSWLDRIIILFIAFGLFILRHFYDVILIKLNPTDAELTLFQ